MSEYVKSFAVDTILNALENPLIITDPDGIILFYNKSAIKNGFPVAGSILKEGIDLIQAVPVHHKKIVNDFLKQAVTTQKLVRREISIKDTNGNIHYFELSFSPLLSNTGDVDQICVTSLDITEK